MSSLIVPENTRQPWSRITNTELLQPKDELLILGIGFAAVVGVLDSHDPSRDHRYRRVVQAAGLSSQMLTDHHHILFQFEGSDEVVATGMFVGQGEPEDLLFPHVRVGLDDDAARLRMWQVAETARGGTHGMYFISENEQLSATPQGQAYIRPDGDLLR